MKQCDLEGGDARERFVGRDWMGVQGDGTAKQAKEGAAPPRRTRAPRPAASGVC